MKHLLDQLTSSGVHTLIAQFTDIHGVAKGKFVPLRYIKELLTCRRIPPSGQTVL